MRIRGGGGGGGGSTIPGLSSDGSNGIRVQHAATIGDASASVVPDFSQVNGVLLVVDTPGNNADFDTPFSVFQQQDLSGDVFINTAFFGRVGHTNGHSYGFAAVGIQDTTGSTTMPALAVTSGATDNTSAFRVYSNGTINSAKGIGLFGHAAPSAPRTLAQSVIDAITDANAKTAVQAVANALADMGALTLT